MKKYVNYNELLDTLFKRWKNSYNEDDRDKFCQDGIVYKNDSSIDVDLLWGQSSRRVAFLLKDCPDGYGYDTRELLLDKIGIEKANKNRELKVKFLKNLAKLLFGLLEMKAGSVFNDKDVDNRIPKVIDGWNSKPFVFIESKKLAGGKTVNEKAIENALSRDEGFLKKELDILRPNIIVCCNATGDSIFNFITKKYFKGKEALPVGGDYIVNDKVVPDMKTCLWYYPQDNVVVIKAFHPSVAANWKVLEKAFSPFRDFITNVNPAF